jgi:hypothetical protein
MNSNLVGASAAVGCIVLVLVLGADLAPSSQEVVKGQTATRHEDGAVEIQMRNVDFRLAPDNDLEVRTLPGRLTRTCTQDGLAGL